MVGIARKVFITVDDGDEKTGARCSAIVSPM
jgi:hypothetical protein